MIEIMEECTRFKTTSQRLADQARTKIKECWFFDLEILEIHEQINWESCQQDPYTITEMLNIDE